MHAIPLAPCCRPHRSSSASTAPSAAISTLACPILSVFPYTWAAMLHLVGTLPAWFKLSELADLAPTDFMGART